MSFLYNYNMNINSVSTAYQICSLIFNMIYNSSISSTRLSIPLSISIPYNSSSKKEELLTKDLDYFQMERLLKWMSLFFEEDEDDKEDENKKETIRDNENDKDNLENKEETKRAYKKELYNIYVGIRSDYKQYLNWKKYNNSIWILPSMRSKNTKDLSKKIISDIELFNEGLKMFSLFNKL